MRRHFLAIVNPVSGRRDMLHMVRRVQELLELRGATLDIAITQRADHATELVANVGARVEALLVVGGDGTLGEVVNGLNGRIIPLVVLRTGTENLFAREMGMPDDPVQIVETLLFGKPYSSDAGLVNDARWFHSVAGIGFDAECVLRMSRMRRGHITHADYFWPIWRAFWAYGFPLLHVRADGLPVFSGRGFAILGVTSRYSVNMRILHQARHDDGLLDLAIFPCATRPRLLMHAARTLLRRQKQSDVQYHQFRELQIESPDSVPFELDGEFGGHLPFYCRVSPGGLTLLRHQPTKPKN